MMDNATASALLSRIAPQPPAQQAIANLLSTPPGQGNFGAQRPPSTPGGGQGLGLQDIVGAITRRLAQVASDAGGNPNYNRPHMNWESDSGAPTPIGLLEHQDFPALAQYEQDIAPPPSGPSMVPAPGNGGDRTMMSRNDHIGLSELAQSALMDQVIKAIQSKQVPGSSPKVPVLPNQPNAGGPGRVVLQPQTTPFAPTWSRRVTT